ncbi:MAG: hypothetical protein KAS32_04675 [Candidatus Peribacteraceae bacterium]|nr:hypothetical protein [Candidatus Peribacteraceae bacterium]
MDYTLEEQLKDLCNVIKTELRSPTDCAGLRELMIAQKTLMESMIIAKHLETLTMKLEDCGQCNNED